MIVSNFSKICGFGGEDSRARVCSGVQRRGKRGGEAPDRHYPSSFTAGPFFYTDGNMTPGSVTAGEVKGKNVARAPFLQKTAILSAICLSVYYLGLKSKLFHQLHA